MAVCQTADTEELLTCLRLQLFHPEAEDVLVGLPFGRRLRQEAEDAIRLGRAAEACNFTLNDSKVSRKQLALQPFRVPGSSELHFTLQNLSRSIHMQVNGTQLGHLVGAELPSKALVRFGRYEILVLVETGDSKTHYEVLFQRLAAAPSQEIGLGPAHHSPVMDTGGQTIAHRHTPSNEPAESDENDSI